MHSQRVKLEPLYCFKVCARLVLASEHIQCLLNRRARVHVPGAGEYFWKRSRQPGVGDSIQQDGERIAMSSLLVRFVSSCEHNVSPLSHKCETKALNFLSYHCRFLDEALCSFSLRLDVLILGGSKRAFFDSIELVAF